MFSGAHYLVLDLRSVDIAIIVQTRDVLNRIKKGCPAELENELAVISNSTRRNGGVAFAGTSCGAR